MLNIAIVEKDIAVTDELSDMINKYASANYDVFEIFGFSDEAALINSDKSFDIIFLDLDEAGIEAAQKIRNVYRCSLMILMSISGKYAVDGYSVDALGYLLKPVTQAYINFWLDYAGKYLNRWEAKRLNVKANGGLVFVDIDKVIYIEVHEHYVLFHVIGKDGKIEIIKTRGTLSEYENKLKDFDFIRSCSTCYINMQYISSVNDDSVYIRILNMALPVTRTYKKVVCQKILSYDNKCKAYRSMPCNNA